MKAKIDYIHAINELNNVVQRKAILHLGNSALSACPGAGKTRTVVLKAAYLINEKINEPKGLACITFSKNAAREFKDRFDELNIPQSSLIFFGTMHSFCLTEVIIPFGKVFLKEIINEKTEVAEDEQREKCMSAALEKNKIKENPRFWSFPVNGIRKILHTKSESLSNKTDKIIEIAKDYENNLRNKNLIDFEDIINYSKKLITNNSFVRKAIAAKFPWIIVDEYQDLGQTLHEIILILLKTNKINVFAVGDPHQSIHGFAGSDPKYFIELSNRKDFTAFDSKYNYRCCQPIIDASTDILKPQAQKEYVSKKQNPKKGDLFIQECPKGIDQQIDLVVNTILPKINQRGVSLGDIAILTYLWKDVHYFEKKLTEKGIPTLIVKEAKYDLTPLTIWIEDLAKWCAGGWKLINPSFDRLFHFWYRYLNILEKRQQRLNHLKERVIFLKKLDKLKQKDMLLKDWINLFNELFEADKLFVIKEGNSHDINRNINSYNQMIKLSENTDFGNQTLSEFKGVKLAKTKLILMTLHGSKGLGFDSVIMPMLEEGIIPSWDGKNIPESRRLFYVGITRTKNEVYLIWSGFNEDKYGRIHKKGKSRFVTELIQSNRCNHLS